MSYHLVQTLTIIESFKTPASSVQSTLSGLYIKIATAHIQSLIFPSRRAQQSLFFPVCISKSQQHIVSPTSFHQGELNTVADKGRANCTCAHCQAIVCGIFGISLSSFSSCIALSGMLQYMCARRSKLCFNLNIASVEGRADVRNIFVPFVLRRVTGGRTLFYTGQRSSCT